METAVQYFTTGNTKLSYTEQGSGLPLIFVHGFPFDLFSWQPQIDALKLNYRVIAYDHRGYGQSEEGIEDFSMELFADDLISLMDNLEIPEAVVCGLSMGGYVVLNAVQRYPTRFKGIILCDTQCVADTTEARDKRFKAIELIRGGGKEKYAEELIKKLFYHETISSGKEVVNDVRNMILNTDAEVMARTLKALALRKETCSGLSELDVPALIICGREDQITPVVQHDRMQLAINGAELKIIDRAGHLSNLEEPEVFNNLVSEFLEGLQ